MCTKPGDVQLTAWELDVVTKVFRSFETGLREGTILTKVIYQPVLSTILYQEMEENIKTPTKGSL